MRGPVSSGPPTATCTRTPPLLGQHQRRLERQLLEDAAADLVAGAQRQLDERRAGQQHHAADGVVGQPRVRTAATAAR